MVVVRSALVILVSGTLGYSGTAFGQALASDPPGKVGRLAFTQGTVSFHDAERTDWEPATINRPLTTGDAVWTEPGAHAEISISGTRVRLDGTTQLDMAQIDDSRTRLQLDQGRVDIKTFAYDAKQPYDLITPRGTATLQQQGDYYVEAGSTQDPTRLGVRQGAAQFQAPDGRVLAVRAGEVAEITGDGSSMELHTIQAPPPPMPQYWAARDKQIVYDQPPQYLSAGVTGYEDLNYYGTWQNDPEYGQVWYVRDAPSGWAPYSTGRWVSEPVYGWTWVDEQPWGFAPYHYGRWAQRNNRWFWVPPDRSQQAVYAPALVAFVGGTELGMALGAQSRAPVGWFPLGPREVYVPPYTSNRDYYRRLNLSARVQDSILQERWDRAQRREAIAEQTWMNRRFATVVPAEAFARSQPVERARLTFDAQKMAAVPVAAVAVPPSPTVSVRTIQAPAAMTTTAPSQTQAPAAPGARATTQTQANAGASLQAPVMQQAIKPETTQLQKAPGPQIASRPAASTTATPGTTATTGTTTGTTATTTEPNKAALPQLAPRNASAPPQPQIQGERKPATTQPAGQQATAPANQPATAPKPAEPAKPGEPPKPPQASTAPAPQAAPKPGEPPKPGQANLPPVPPKPGQPPQASTQPAAPTAQLPKPPQASTAPAPQAAPKPGEPPKPPQASNTAPPQQRQAPPPQPPHQATPPAPAPQQQQLQRAPQPSAPPPPAQTHVAPSPQPQAPPPQRQAAPAAPPPQVHAPAPPPQPQHQAAPPPAPKPPSPPPQQAQQAPHPAPAPAPPPQQKPQPQPQQQGQQHKPDEKKTQ